MEYFDLVCSIVLRLLWFYGGYMVFFRKINIAPFTDTKWGARLAGTLFMVVVLVDTYHKWFAN
ncbi:hypothetical protein PHABIO_29 [Pseudomonas phage Phabio]|uniref:Uncharacterized protein n=1 Tax=Pseudomonas phage Phabio TaxID=2006668 RepID=A0A1Y0STL7_9CAUD|nr:hypothetical protein MZD05_gp029 [Pseudomonas phage Phabio]ARV76660.1 hypothetical protein PHABIO_29 [Pseudomonas phage Phabio]